MIHIQRIEMNMLSENCYILSDDTREAVIVDCGAYYDEDFAAIDDYIQSHQLRPVHHLLTHGHFDHVFGAQYLYEHYGLAPELSLDDFTTYHEQPQQIQLFMHRPLPIALPAPVALPAHGEYVTFGNHRLRVLATPGHTPGGVCFFMQEEDVLLSGDSLFAGSIGRCDLPRSEPAALPRALRTHILALPDSVRVYPGHGHDTTIAHERLCNPYLA